MPLLDLSESRRSHRDVIIRTDVNQDIGSGHAVRCMAIADSVERQGGSVLFAVSHPDSASILLEAGKDCIVIPGDWLEFGVNDGDALGILSREIGSASILVDSYAVTDTFFNALDESAGKGCRIAWIDDRYTYELEKQLVPVQRRVDCVVNYSLGMSLEEYEAAYAGADTTLCIGPHYAPLRSQFYRYDERSYEKVERIMVTTGSTNEGRMLERMTSACLQAVPSVQIDVIVGGMSEFASFDDCRVIEHRGIADLAPFMCASDICISAAGTTLYELSAIGVPVVAVPIVENQRPNAAGFKRLGLGYVADNDSSIEDELINMLTNLVQNPAQRRAFVSTMHCTIDGKGAERIAFELQK